jgi:hypothetical protein
MPTRIALFTSFQEGKKGVDELNVPLIILRHDVDMDLAAALRMALIEKELGIHSTYLFMVGCPLYNVFSLDGRRQVEQILDCGHLFGLHFDCVIYNGITRGNLNHYVSRECHLLEWFFGRQIEAVSFHRPGSMELSGIELEKLPNSYELVFREKFEYFSDSRGKWIRGEPIDSEAFHQRKNLHICIHPIWWTVEPKSAFECLTDLVQRIGIRNEQSLSENCSVWDEGKRVRGT